MVHTVFVSAHTNLCPVTLTLFCSACEFCPPPHTLTHMLQVRVREWLLVYTWVTSWKPRGGCTNTPLCCCRPRWPSHDLTPSQRENLCKSQTNVTTQFDFLTPGGVDEASAKSESDVSVLKRPSLWILLFGFLSKCRVEKKKKKDVLLPRLFCFICPGPANVSHLCCHQGSYTTRAVSKNTFFKLYITTGCWCSGNKDKTVKMHSSLWLIWFRFR